ncbi:MAG: hypothetical protein KDD70_10725, partial [Bdellovibrionales bacterium]|nr:hypothetical protein [Bdellovibrionales bacterium]
MLEVPRPRPLQSNAHVGLPAVRDTVDETPGPALNRNLPTIEGKLETILQNPDYAIRFVNLGEYIEIL